MNTLIASLEKVILPFAVKIGKQPHVNAIKNGFIRLMPLTLTGAMFVLINNVFLSFGEGSFFYSLGVRLDASTIETLNSLKSIGGSVYNGTLGIMSLMTPFFISMALAEERKVDPLASALLAATGLEDFLGGRPRHAPRWLGPVAAAALTVWSARQLWRWAPNGPGLASGLGSVADTLVMLGLFALGLWAVRARRRRSDSGLPMRLRASAASAAVTSRSVATTLVSVMPYMFTMRGLASPYRSSQGPRAFTLSDSPPKISHRSDSGSRVRSTSIRCRKADGV